jgi:hypothetical protein
LQSKFHHPQRRILVTSFLVAINAPQCAEALGSSEKKKIHAFELQQLQLGIAQGFGCLGFSLSLSLSLDQGIECLGFWFSQDFLSLSARELNA